MYSTAILRERGAPTASREVIVIIRTRHAYAVVRGLDDGTERNNIAIDNPHRYGVMATLLEGNMRYVVR